MTNIIHLHIMPNMKITKEQRIHFEARASVLKALAHPLRLFMVEALSKQPYCVYELTDMVGLEISTVSRHLSVLKNAGLVQDQKRGKHVFYNLRVHCVLNFLDCVEAVLKEQAQDFKTAISLDNS